VRSTRAASPSSLSKALAAFELMGEVAKKQILWVRSGLMLSYFDARQTDKANALVASTLEYADSLLQEDDPNLALTLQLAAMVRSYSDRVSALHLIERSIRILEGLHGPASSALVDSLRTYEHILRVAKDRKTAKLVEARIRRITQPAAK
jgi:hypothetical protein